ncbi:hypothetical protein ACYZTX_12790 [Pseudomonas sp. MDT1-17]
MSIKDTLAKLDDAVLTELLDNAQFALNDMATAKKVAKEFGTPLARVQALAYLAVQLSMEPDRVPDITTVSQVNALQTELANR